jgi:hypothetical protein
VTFLPLNAGYIVVYGAVHDCDIMSRNCDKLISNFVT